MEIFSAGFINSRSWRDWSRPLATIAVLSLLYYITARLGHAMGAVSGFATLVWPPTGISLAALLILGYWVWPGVFIGAVLANVAVGASVPVALSIGLGNTGEALIAAYLLRRTVGFHNALDRFQDAIGLIVCAAVLSTIVSATVGVLSLWASGIVSSSTIVHTWLTWWIGDSIANLVVAPLILVWSTPLRFRVPLSGPMEFVAIGALMLSVSTVIFGLVLDREVSNYLLAYMIFPAIIWAALWFGQHGGVTASFIVSAIAIWGTYHGYGPFSGDPLNHPLLLLQIFIGITSSTTLVLAAVVTERRSAEESARESELKYRTLVESMNEGLLLVDQNDVIQFVNERFCDMLGYAREELIGKVGYEILLQEEDRSFMREQNRRRTQNISDRYEIQLKKKSGERIWVQISASPITDTQGTVVGSIGVLTDISERKWSEEALRNSEARFESLFAETLEDFQPAPVAPRLYDNGSAIDISDLAQKINQVSDTLHHRVQQVLSFSSLASHELKTPLAIVRSQLESVLRPDVSVHALRKVLVSTYDEILRLSNTIRDLLSLGTMLAGTLKMNRERVEFLSVLRHFYEDAVLMCQEKDIAIDLEKGPEIFAELDVPWFRRVLFNLLENSLKHTPPKGRIHLSYGMHNNQIVFTFADTGSGIPDDQLNRIFNSFTQAPSAAGSDGVGLGLALVIRIVEAHGGSIGVESKQGHGTVCTISLPKCNSSTTPSPFIPSTK